MPEHRWLMLRLAAPLMAFGGVTIDNIGVTRDLPAASMLTGLFANALGWRRTDWAAHQSLQDRLIFATRIDMQTSAGLLTDVQNARLEKNDRGWTTFGTVEGRDGNSYDGPHRRWRDYHMDAEVMVALRLLPGAAPPDLDNLAEALDRPRRPLFIGRKPCLPTGRLFHGFSIAASAHDALGAAFSTQAPHRALWPLGEGPEEGRTVDRISDLADLRDWRAGLHTGTRQVVEGRLPERSTP
jgi:CRISPR system Cascade subunit CasD